MGTTWSTAKHDQVPDIEMGLPSMEVHTYLRAFLESDGKPFVAPYAPVRSAISGVLDGSQRQAAQKPTASISDQRLRTWKSVFESFGFLHVDEATGKEIELTQLGRLVRRLTDDLNEKIEGANDHLAMLAVQVLSRHTLRNPLDSANYPADTDVHPYRLMWSAMRQLDNRINWQEMNRVLMHVTREDQVEEAVARIASVRASVGGTYDDAALARLGVAAVDDGDETRRRITPWIARAGFGGLLITSKDAGDGYYQIVDKHVQLIDEALSEEVIVPPSAMASPDQYLAYLTDLEAVVADPAGVAEEDLLSQARSAVESYGHKKVICLAGIPGTGKTRLAKMLATELSDGDPYRLMEIQFHESTGYDQFVEGFVPRPDGQGFELVSMTFRVINRRARLDPNGSPYVLLIEELTRANIHAVLGELLTYVEHRDMPFRLTLSQDNERVAPNLVILATMNPRDRSALILDHAILRRLHQVKVGPSAAVLKEMLSGQLDPDSLSQLIAWFEKYLIYLPFGHGEFAGVKTGKDLHSLWMGTLLHFFLDATGEVPERYQKPVDDFPWA